VSYELDPCDELKRANWFGGAHGVYRKSAGEDLRSIITGYRSQGGRAPYIGPAFVGAVSMQIRSRPRSIVRSRAATACFDALHGGENSPD